MRQLKKSVWPHKVSLKTVDVDQIEIWLGSVFKNRWHVVCSHQSTDFYFKKQQDAVWFALRWDTE